LNIFSENLLIFHQVDKNLFGSSIFMMLWLVTCMI